jgi:hypothetical protein
MFQLGFWLCTPIFFGQRTRPMKKGFPFQSSSQSKAVLCSAIEFRKFYLKNFGAKNIVIHLNTNACSKEMKRKILLLFVFSFVCVCVHAQFKVPKLKYTTKEKIQIIDSTVNALLCKSDLIIMYRTSSVWSFNAKYRVMYHDTSRLWHFLKLEERNAEKKLDQTIIDISQDSIQKLFLAFSKNDLFQLKNGKDINKKCGSMILDAVGYEFIFVTKSAYKVLSYYAPEFYETECPGSEERKKIIRCIEVVFSRKTNTSS